MSERNEWLALDDEALLRLCRCEAVRGTGPGGQKRNKTSTAIRLTHLPSGITVTDDVSRSQHQNRDAALRKLRLQLALELRDTETVACGPMPQEKAKQPQWAAYALDALETADYKVSDAATALGLSTGRFTKDLAHIPALWQIVNANRAKRNLPLLRT